MIRRAKINPLTQAVIQLGKPLRDAPRNKLKFPLVFYSELRGEILKSLRKSAKTQPQLAAQFPGIAYGKIRYMVRTMEEQGKIHRVNDIRPFFYTTKRVRNENR